MDDYDVNTEGIRIQAYYLICVCDIVSGDYIEYNFKSKSIVPN